MAFRTVWCIVLLIINKLKKNRIQNARIHTYIYILKSIHYYKNVDLSRLGNPCCPSLLTGNASPGQKEVPFCPWSGNRDKRGPFVPGQKVLPAPTWLAHPFVPVGVTNRDKRSLFFHVFLFSIFFYFNYTFAFQLNLCIGIQCVWSPLIYTYIYI